MIIGYARVSSVGQSLDVQLAQLEAHGAERIFREKVSGTSTKGRDELERAIETLRDGDVLVVTRLDRLARSVGDLHAILERIHAAGAGFQCIGQAGVDTTTSTGKLMLSILGAVAEFENDIRAERQRDGIARAKENGVYRRRQRTPVTEKRVDRAEVKALLEQSPPIGPSEIARKLGIGRTTVYRIEAELVEAGELAPTDERVRIYQERQAAELLERCADAAFAKGDRA